MPGYTTDPVLLERETATPGTYAAVAQVINVDPPELKRKSVEVEVQGEDYPRVMPTRLESQTVTFELLFDPDLAGHKQFETDAGNKASINLRISYPGTGPRRELFTGFVESFKIDGAPAEGKELKAMLTIKLTSKRTVAP